MERSVLQNEIERLVYSEYRQMQPPETLKPSAEYLMKLAKGYINMGDDGERLVSVAYYADDIVPRLSKLRVCKENVKVLSLNLMTMEFLADMLVFREYRDIGSFEYVIGKYLRLQQDDKDNVGFVRFFSWLYSQYKDQPRYDYTKHLARAVAGCAFLVMHEWSHTQEDLIGNIMPLLDSTEEIKPCYTNDQGEEDPETKIEICCDFNALELCAASHVENLFGLTRREFLRVALLASFVPALYKELKKVFWVNTRGKKELIEELKKSMKSRVTAICILIKIAQNSKNMYYEDQDIDTAMEEFAVIQEWLNMNSDYLINHLQKRADFYNALPEEERAQVELYNFQGNHWSLLA